MANEPLALAIRPPEAPQEAPQEDAYLTLCAALSQSARGRAFLAEHARRGRNADNEALLTAIGRIEARLQADASAVQRLRDDLRMLVTAIRLARPEIDAADPPARAVKLAKLLDLFERRIDAMAEAGAPAPAAGDASDPRIAAVEPTRAQLFVLPMRNEPEAPPSGPATIAAPKAEVVPDAAVAKAASPPAEVLETVAAPPVDPLAALMALSADERLALFT